MKSLIIGIVILAASVFAMLPQDRFGLGWGGHVLEFLQGGAPVIAVLIGIIAVFIGIADIKDRGEARKEKRKPAEEAEKEQG